MTIRNLQLTPNFKLGEFLQAGVHEAPPQWILDNLYFLANRLQVVRDILGKPITITSGYRTSAHNKAVGGAPQSLHLSGMAADIVVPGMPAREVQKVLKNWSGGMGSYLHFTHLDCRKSKARWGE